MSRFFWLHLLLFITTHCYAHESPKPFFTENWRATLVTAEGSSKPGDIRSVNDHFTFSQRIHAHLTLVAKQPSTVVPKKSRFTFKWFNGNTLVHQRSAIQSLAKSPNYLLHAVPASVLGVGECKVEAYSENELLAVREFAVSER